MAAINLFQSWFKATPVWQFVHAAPEMDARAERKADAPAAIAARRLREHLADHRVQL